MWQQAMEAQFFIHLRKYLFPPAILALKHVIEGAMFHFEKPLIVDAMLKLLMSLCPRTIEQNELFDCIPLLFCWILEHCNPNEKENANFEIVNLVDWTSHEKAYIKDPVSLVSVLHMPLILRERSNVSIPCRRHADLRSLMKHLIEPQYYADISSCKAKEYIIYNPNEDELTVSAATVNRLTNRQLQSLYAAMRKKYQSFILITQENVRSSIQDRLALLHDRPVCLLFKCRRVKNQSRDSTTLLHRLHGINHVFEAFHPLQSELGKKTFIRQDEIICVNTDRSRDRPLPEHLIAILSSRDDDQTFNPHNGAPTRQITVVLLDVSRSMFENRASIKKEDSRSVFEMSIIMLGTLSDNIVSRDQAHAFGLVHFGDSVNTSICPITRKRDEFEQALMVEPKKEEWTCMYEAIDRAISLIVAHERGQQNNVAKNCRKLIICISDGINNRTGVNLEDLLKRCKTHHIVVDFISFLRDTFLDPQQSKVVHSFRKFCRDTEGYAYENLPLSNIELGATFEQEAAVWLSTRDPSMSVSVEKPVRQIPKQLTLRATCCFPIYDSRSTHGNQLYTRVFREAHDIKRSNLNYATLFVCHDDIFFWKIVMKGPFGTPYDNGRWLLYVQFDDRYPAHPPSVRFFTNIYHVNISSDGKVCHHLFDRGWSNQTSMVEVFEAVLELLTEPNFDDAVSTEKAQLKSDSPEEYDKQAKKYTRIYAMRSIEQLKKEFHLED